MAYSSHNHGIVVDFSAVFFTNGRTETETNAYKLTLLGVCRKQKSCAIAKMTARCTRYMGALKIFGSQPEQRP